MFLDFTNISSLAFFSFIPTFSYTSAAIISTNLWIGSLLFYFNNLNRKEVSAITLIIIALYFALISRIQFFLPLLFLTPIAIYIISKRSGYQSGTTIKRLSLSLTFSSFNDLIQKVDFIVLVIPHTDESEGLIGKRELKMMKKSAIIINTSRGGVVNEKDLNKRPEIQN